MKPGNKQEHIKLWKVTTTFGNLTLLRARYINQTFARHSHEDFPVGVIEDGALGFYYRGENVVAPQGSINLANPGEAHTGEAVAKQGWMYRMFYFDLALMRNVITEIAGKPMDIPFFQSGVLHDPDLAARLQQLHRLLEQTDTTPLEQESCLLETLTDLITRHADNHLSISPIGEEHRAVTRAKEYIETFYSDNITLEDLANTAYLSPFHLARVFHEETGLPPHAYLTQVRITKAKALLAQGWSISEVAYELGFVDQSHFHRRFKRIVGMTPGQYRKNINGK